MEERDVCKRRRFFARAVAPASAAIQVAIAEFLINLMAGFLLCRSVVDQIFCRRTVQRHRKALAGAASVAPARLSPIFSPNTRTRTYAATAISGTELHHCPADYDRMRRRSR